jgi:hypothetical protein
MIGDARTRTSARRLVDTLESAKPIPLTNQVRFDKATVYELADAINEGADAEQTATLRALAAAASAVKDAAHNAMPVPLTDQVRLPRERIEELVRGLRAAGA